MKEIKSWITKDISFRRTLTPESDRGAALMAAAYLDSQLDNLLRRTFVDDASVAEDLLGQSKPIGTFSSRIDLAFALGLVGRSVHCDLHLIRKIRNDFGHVPTPIGFDHQPIASRCREFTHSYYEKGAPPRARFFNTVMGVLVQIRFAEFYTQHATPAKDKPPSFELKREVRAKADKMWNELMEHLRNEPKNA